MWDQILLQLELRTEGRHESGAFLLGRVVNDRREVLDALYYEDLDSDAYSTGVCVLRGDGFALLWQTCRESSLTVVGDVHTHPGAAVQSYQDRTNPMVARSGHVAIIVPLYARQPIDQREFGIYEYRGEHVWNDRGGESGKTFFYRGFWS
jgi:proteasome lid subunit RPN8/RPN11